MPKIAIATYSTPNRRELYDITNVPKEVYAYWHGIDFRFAEYELPQEYPDPRMYHPAWIKPWYIRHLFRSGYDVVFWMDDDASFVQDFPVEAILHYSDNPIYFTEDENGLNCGVGIFNGVPETMEYLDWMCGESTNPKWNGHWFDQDATILLDRTHPRFFGRLPGNLWNAHHPGFDAPRGCPNVFDPHLSVIVHVAGGDERKRELLQNGELKRIFGADRATSLLK